MIANLLAIGVFSEALYDTPPSRVFVLPLPRRSMILPPKFVDEALDYQLDWSIRLDGDTIVRASTATISGAAITNRVLFNASSSSFWISGGRTGNGSIIRCIVATAGGRTLEQFLNLRCL